MTFEALGLHPAILKALADAATIRPRRSRRKPSLPRWKAVISWSRRRPDPGRPLRSCSRQSIGSPRTRIDCARPEARRDVRAFNRHGRGCWCSRRPASSRYRSPRQPRNMAPSSTGEGGRDPGRHAVSETDAAAGARPADPGRHARPPARPHAVRQDRLFAARDPGAGRSRSHARHGLHRGHRDDRGCDAGNPPDHAVLRHPRRTGRQDGAKGHPQPASGQDRRCCRAA